MIENKTNFVLTGIMLSPSLKICWSDPLNWTLESSLLAGMYTLKTIKNNFKKLETERKSDKEKGRERGRVRYRECEREREEE